MSKKRACKNRITGVVMDLASWYVPTVLNWRDRFVKTTNPQNDAARGAIFTSFSLTGLKIPRAGV